MIVRLSIVILLCASAPALAQHDHHHGAEQHAAENAFAAGVSLVAATFDTMLYTGNYQGVIPSLSWSSSRFAALASGSVYRLEKNGASAFGLGDVGVHGQVRLVGNDAFDAGLAVGVSLPTGNSRQGFGMGHLMVMPAAFGSWATERVRVAASFGYSRALGDDDGHMHGAWPLVSPMMSAEWSWNVGGEVLVNRRFTAGARGAGGIPAGEGGEARVMVAGRVAWHAKPVDTAFELQAGVAGDPFTVRGVVSTALAF